ncbi:TolC family protein [Chitinivorax sp. B]|uniref:TolC family protein n=1 Tax=Chitinivorax sp. B TaxID=2502235 RepID=UPI001485AFFC|nr:TolC family protein [Chitinivorax sp. B]
MAWLLTWYLAWPAAQAAETLQQAWEAALKHDRPVQAAAQQYAASQQLLAAAEGACWPGLSVEAAYIRLDDTPAATASLPHSLLPVTMPTRIDMPLSKDRFQTRSATLTLPLFTSGRISQNIKAANASVGMTSAELIRTRQNSKLLVAKAYLNVLRTQQLQRVANHHLTSLQAHQHDVDHFFEQGLVARADQLAIQVALADAQQKRIQATNAVDLANAAYNRALQRPMDNPVDLAESQLSPDQQPLSQLEHLAQQRAELDQLSHGNTALTAQARAVRGEAGPQLALIAGYHHLDNPYLKQDRFRSLTLGVKWDVFDGGVTRHKAAAIEARAQALQLQRDEVQSWIELEVRQAWHNQQEAHLRKQVAMDALDYADENLKVARDRYTHSLAPQSEVLDAETRRTVAQSNAQNAHYDEQLAILQLQHAIGSL